MAQKCNLCPRNCNVDRAKQCGYCKSSDALKIARVGLHMWEEPCISHKNGSGTIFFSGCNMGCVFCQNSEISHLGKGMEITVDTLCDEILRLWNMGADNINLVTPTHYADKICQSLLRVKSKINIPVVYNTSSYEKVQTLKMLDGLVDVYLPDLKYYSAVLSEKYSKCADYFETSIEAVKEMIRQTGKPVFIDDSKLIKGTLVRHLVLPSLYRDSINILDELEKRLDVSKIGISVMCQYFPAYKAKEYKELCRRVTTLEYMKVVEKAKGMDFAFGYFQDKDSAKEDYVPQFNYGEENGK